MRSIFIAALIAVSACASAATPTQSESCLPVAGYDRARLDALKAAEWALSDEGERNTLARALTACLGSPDPALRDGVVFEALQHWLRAKQLTPETMRALAADLEAQLTASDPQGFRRPFAALVLSEVARADRVEAYLTEAERIQLVDAAVSYMTGIDDYRGFDQREGWRHGVAHTADLMLQLTLNPEIERPELLRIRDAVAAQVAPAGHAYTFGESERLARPILFMARRGIITTSEWTEWFTELAGTEASWQGTFASEEKLARRHNLTAFAATIYINADLDSQDLYGSLVPGATAMLGAIP